MANKEWRPDDWDYIVKDIVIDFKEMRSVIVNKDVLEASASAMLSVRDKWWIEQIDKIVNECIYPYGNSKCSKENPACSRYLDPYCDRWQSLKQSLEVKE